MAAFEEANLHRFLPWLQANGVELRGCTIKYCGPNRGFGVFSNAGSHGGDGVAMVVPLDLSITPMRVLQDPLLGPRCRAMFEDGGVDDRFLVMLYLIVQRLRTNSPWKPYLDMLPSTFSNPLWFTEDEFAELKGTTLYRATMLQRKKLQALYDDKVRGLVVELFCNNGLLGRCVREVHFEDFLWANSIFWTRALNIPFPHAYVFPEATTEQDNTSACHDKFSRSSGCDIQQETETGRVRSSSACHDKFSRSSGCDIQQETETGRVKENFDDTSKLLGAETVWVEGLIPGIDFCNHGVKAAATWEIDQKGSITGVPSSMYLILVDQSVVGSDEEIYISYGNKGNEELLYLYGFVIDNNPDDYLMVHYPMEAFRDAKFSDSKVKLLEIQKAELRCLLPRSLLQFGFFAGYPFQVDRNKSPASQFCNYSWSGQRKVPSYLAQLVFPQEFLTSLRTIAMLEHEHRQLLLMLEEVVGSGEEKQPSDKEVQAAVWEACGDYGALELLVDILRMKLTELEEASGTEDSDAELLGNFHFKAQTRNKWSCIVYRRGQKQLTSLFLKEAEHALELCASERADLC